MSHGIGITNKFWKKYWTNYQTHIDGRPGPATTYWAKSRIASQLNHWASANLYTADTLPSPDDQWNDDMTVGDVIGLSGMEPNRIVR